MMNDAQKSIRLLRHLDSEAKLLEQLQDVCDRFSRLIERSTATSPVPLDLQPAEELLEQFSDNAQIVLAQRKNVVQLINQLENDKDDITIRQFIHRSNHPMRHQLESKRNEIVERMHSIRTQLTGDSAVVFYSFDFYRRIVNGLVNCIVEEQGYDHDGKTSNNNSGKFIQKAC